MTKIALFAPHPDMPTGYANQVTLIAPRLVNAGYDVAIFATAGVESHPLSWRGIPVFPKTPYADIGEDVVTNHAARWGADLVITMLCTWIIKYPQIWRNMRVIHQTPVDCTPMSMMDYRVICDTGGMPAAISRFGERVMRAGGVDRAPLDPLYLPNGIDTRVFTPQPDRETIRSACGFDGKFVVGMNFMNNDRDRKNIRESFIGFARFHELHPDSVLAVHAIQALPEGINLPALARQLGIEGAVAFSPQYDLVCGMITPPMLADWYTALDVYLGLGNEGYGLPHVEAQACGVPVILGDWSTGPDLVGPGWLVSGQERYNDAHKAMWGLPYIADITESLCAAHENAGKLRDDARDNALAHDIGRVFRDHWEPALGELDG